MRSDAALGGLHRERDGFFHPESEDELCSLVRAARARRMQLRVRGSAHSTPGAIYTDGRSAGSASPGVDVMLDRYAEVAFDEARRQVTVQAGCRFGADPRDPTGSSNERSGLCFRLEERGWALPVLAGVTHQTVAGFFATGSEGGSLAHALSACVVAMRIVDGTGTVHAISRERDGDLFDAALVSLGLLGVVSTVTLQCEARYDVMGAEETSRENGRLFAAGPGGALAMLRNAEYARMLWWPQPGVERVTTWCARRMRPEDYSAETGPPGALVARPYRSLPPILGSELPAQAAAGAALELLGRAIHGRPGGATPVVQRLHAAACRAFVPIDRRAPRAFWDAWHRALPMDNAIDERFLPTSFTELWVPISRADSVMRELREHYARGGYAAAGAFCCEIYGAPASRAWLSPAYGEDAVRLNLFWLERNPGDPRRTYFPQFWELLRAHGFRLHWGKLLDGAPPGAAYVRAHYPRLGDFLKLRAELDPDQVFVTEYWRRHLEIEPPPRGSPRPENARGGNETPEPRVWRGAPEPPPAVRKWPMYFRLAATEPAFAERASFVLDNVAVIEASPERAFDVFAGNENVARWVPLFRHVDWLTDARSRVGAAFDETFDFMTIRVRIVEFERGKRLSLAVDAVSLPLATEMLEVIEFEPRSCGGAFVRWRVFYDPLPAMRSLHPILRPFFAWLFREATARFAAYVDSEATAG